MSVARIYRVGSPYNGVDLADLDYAQSAETMYIAHINHPPTSLVRSDHTAWSFNTLTFGPTLAAPADVAVIATVANMDAANSGDAYFPEQQRYCVTAVDQKTGQESRASAIVTCNNDLGLKRNYNEITWTELIATSYHVYKSVGFGSFGYIGTTDQTGVFIDDNIGPDYANGPPDPQYPFQISGEFPSTIGFYQQRLLWARTNNHPNAIYASRAGEYENMDESLPLRASDALSFALVAGKVNAVNELVPMASLLALTSDGVFSITGGQDGYLTPSNITTSRQTGRGSSRLKPLVLDNIAFYQPSIGSSVRTLGYQFETDGYNSNDMTIFSPHLFRGMTIASWTYAAEPLSIIWAARSDGILLAFTWQQEQQVWGWTTCDVGGFVENVCSISELGEDRVYLTVVRNGVRTLERLASAFWTALDDACFMDAAVAYFFTSPSVNLTGLSHLEGQAVVALADGEVIDGLTVTGGQVTLPTPVNRATVGLPFTAQIQTLPLALQTPSGGWTIAKPQQITKVQLRVLNSRGVLVGPSTDKLTEIRPRTNEPFGSPPNLMTGICEAILDPYIRSGDRGDAGVSIVVQSSDPLPLTVTEIFYDPSMSG